MSSDDGTYILVLKDGYRVSQFHAVENLLNSVEYVLMAFEGKIRWDCQEKALNYAHTLEKDRSTEYGVLILDQYKDRIWGELKSGKTYFHCHL